MIEEYGVEHTAFRHGQTKTVVDQARDPKDRELTEALLDHILSSQAELGRPQDARIVTRTTETTGWA
jgi:hypothetical protein